MGRTLRKVEDGLEYEADEKHQEAIKKEMQIELRDRGLDCPVVKEELEADFDEDIDDPELEGAATWYRGIAARANFLALDRMDFPFASKEACRQMSKPRVSGQERLLRMARYLHKYPRVVWKFGRGGRHSRAMRS